MDTQLRKIFIRQFYFCNQLARFSNMPIIHQAHLTQLPAFTACLAMETVNCEFCAIFSAVLTASSTSESTGNTLLTKPTKIFQCTKTPSLLSSLRSFKNLVFSPSTEVAKFISIRILYKTTDIQYTYQKIGSFSAFTYIPKNKEKPITTLPYSKNLFIAASKSTSEFNSALTTLLLKSGTSLSHSFHLCNQR